MISELSNREKSLLEILIHEIQERKPNKAITELLQSWIEANNLHPEKCQTMTQEEFEKWFKKRGGK